MAQVVAGWHRPLLLSHARADGDAIGSLCAMRQILSALGHQPTALLFEPLQARYAWLPGEDTPEVTDGPSHSAFNHADAIMILDTCAYAQLEPVADWLRQSHLPTLVVDHHVTRDELGDHHVIDPQASATCLVLYEWARHVGWELNEPARIALYVGLATDTGWFRFSNTDQRTLAAAAELVGAGVRPAAVHEHIYQSESPARFRLIAAALAQAQLHHQDRLAVLTLTRRTFQETGAVPADTEDLVNYPLQIATVDVSVLLVEQDDGRVRVSFRSKPPTTDRADVDVSALAKTFGGGGHQRAAAARLEGTIDRVKQTVIEAVGHALT
ncbi:MAG: bifunctional oligoribonuclease/PAP phosphatase NrnA [Phycisphaerae bacterium]